MGDVSGTDPRIEPVEPWDSIFVAVSDHCQHTGPVVEPIGCLDCAEITDEVVAALTAHDPARQALAAIRGDIAYVESTYKICEPDPLSDWSAGVTWMIDRLSALLSGVLGEAQQDRSSNDG